MKRLEFSEKKRLALKFIEKIREGYRLTGPNNAFKQAIDNAEPLPIQQASLYQFIMSDDELSQEYAQARILQKGRVLGGSKQLGFEQRVKLLELIIENIAQGMNIRGDTYRKNAIVEACRVLEMPLVHWATVHRWLRVEHKDLREKYQVALEAGKNKLHDTATCGKIATGKI